VKSLEDIISVQLRQLQKHCPSFSKVGSCGRSNACVCSAVAEVNGYCMKTLPSGFEHSDLGNLNGIANGCRVLPEYVVRRVLGKIGEYCFGEDIADSIPNRTQLNLMSKMDIRFNEGHNLIIHGGNAQGGSRNKIPLGKTLVASIVMREAIWRRMFSSNKAFSYMFTSSEMLIESVFSSKRMKEIPMARTVDWLCIDDIYTGRSHLSSVLDEVVSHRMSVKLPTIIVLQFDAAQNVEVENDIGHFAAKMLRQSGSNFVISIP
jgi:hypothetical protein